MHSAKGQEKVCHVCEEGEGHGPYWYANGEYGGLKYIGKELPTEITDQLKRIEARREGLKVIHAQANKRAEEARRTWDYARDEVRAIDALLHGQRPDPQILKALDLEEFIL